MHVEKLIYAYLAVCLALIVFNCACIFMFRRRDQWLHRHSADLEKTVCKEMDGFAQGASLSEEHYAFLCKKMRFVNNLMAFDEMLSKLLSRQPQDTQQYLRAIRPIFNELAKKNYYYSSMQRAYFAYVVKKYGILAQEEMPIVLGFMMALLEEPSLYCRENALQAIYSTGNPQAVLRALRRVDIEERFHHEKLLTDGLLSFNGDLEELMKVLWERFDVFSVQMQIVILDFIRFGGGKMAPEILNLLVDEKRDDELRFSCIRYFGKMTDEAAYPVLLTFLERADAQRWEYAAISATALDAYPHDRTILALKQALYSPNWYIRFNAAKSLERFHLTYLDLSDVMNSGDRYAREILQYQFDMQRAKAQGEAVPT